jgi:hypothetical protein
MFALGSAVLPGMMRIPARDTGTPFPATIDEVIIGGAAHHGVVRRHERERQALQGLHQNKAE